MKDMPFFLLKNSLGAKMKKGIKTFCNNNGSTSTLNQQNSSSSNNSHTQGDFTSKVSLSSPSSKQNSPTLEDLILQLELEEDMARKAKLSEYSGMRGRMSCVNNSDILRSARNALNQYPRFSLDGRDAMYRSSFGNMEGRRSVCSETSFGGVNDLDQKGMCCLPPTLAGESVVWRKPGVVAKLMGLEAMPVPVGSKRCDEKEKLSSVVKRQNLRRRFERHDLERRLLTMEMQQGYHHNIRRHTKNNGCCSKNGYCIMKPVALETLAGGPSSWQPRRYA
ncbi:DnaK family protein [Spatholobus suberectus]|nr:DnaK family protein [Spatholobus suberectus]